MNSSEWTNLAIKLLTSLAPDNLGKRKTIKSHFHSEIIIKTNFRTVYKCVDGNNNVRCIKQIKLVNTSNALAATHFEMIQQEIYLLQHLAHPRIISLMEYFCLSNNDDICIVMEYASYGPLSKMIAERNVQKDFLPEYVRLALFL